MAEIEYPGIAKLVSRLVWDQEPVRSSRTTRTKIPLKSTISEGFWSEWGDSNARSLEPKSSAIPASLHPDIQFPPLYHGGEENQRFFCLWSFMWSKPLLCRLQQSGKIPQMQASQGFAAFHLTPSRIPTRHSQTTHFLFFVHTAQETAENFCRIDGPNCIARATIRC